MLGCWPGTTFLLSHPPRSCVQGTTVVQLATGRNKRGDSKNLARDFAVKALHRVTEKGCGNCTGAMARHRNSAGSSRLESPQVLQHAAVRSKAPGQQQTPGIILVSCRRWAHRGRHVKGLDQARSALPVQLCLPQCLTKHASLAGVHHRAPSSPSPTSSSLQPRS